MILDYDTRPDATFDEKIRSLRDSIQLALNELESYAEGQRTKGNAEAALRIARQALAAATGGAEPSTTIPLMDGTAAIGTEQNFARGDHRHPSDTSKVDKETGKGLSTEDYTSDEKTKLAGIAAGAEVNVQADWSQADNTEDDYIKNKPSLATVATSGSYNDLLNQPTIPAAQIQADWDQADATALDYIKNKPTIPGGDSRLITNDVDEVEFGFNSQYNSYNINIVDTNGDAVSINNIADPSINGNPKITLLPDNDWDQAQQVGVLALMDDIPTIDSAMSSSSTNPVQNKVINIALGNKSNLLTTDTASGSASSIAAEGDASVTISISKTGYTPLGIIGITKSGSANARVDIASFTISGSNAIVQLHNASGSAKSNIGVTVTVLYVKS